MYDVKRLTCTERGLRHHHILIQKYQNRLSTLLTNRGTHQFISCNIDSRNTGCQ